MSSSDDYGDPATRHRILEATWELVAVLGPKLRLADVAARAGVSRQAVYLHFEDRRGLLLALVSWADEIVGLPRLAQRVWTAPSGADALDRMVEVHAAYAPRIDPVAQVLEDSQLRDEALAAAWRDRMDSRRAAHRQVIERIHAEGMLGGGWTVDTATDVFYALTMPGTWRELTQVRGWSAEEYSRDMKRLLRRALLAPPQD